MCVSWPAPLVGMEGRKKQKMPFSGKAIKQKMTGDPDDLVGTDWVKSHPRLKGTRPLGWEHLLVTCRRPNRLIKWGGTSHGGGVGPWDRHRVGVLTTPLQVSMSVKKKIDKNAVFGQKGAEFGHDP